jgi:hypothetical protein
LHCDSLGQLRRHDYLFKNIFLTKWVCTIFLKLNLLFFILVFIEDFSLNQHFLGNDFLFIWRDSKLLSAMVLTSGQIITITDNPKVISIS